MPVINNGVVDGVRRIGARVRDLIVDGGLPGAPLGYRLRGATQSGSPQTGTWKAGDHIEDRNGVIWICTAGGTGAAATWVQTGTVTGVTAADTSVVVAGTSQAPTVRTGTIDVIAADHPAAADWSNNSHKITSLASGSAPSDAAAFGQTVTGILTTLGDIIYENATPAPARLAGNTTATRKFLRQAGNGSVSAAPAWDTLQAGDLAGLLTQYVKAASGVVPSATANTYGTTVTVSADAGFTGLLVAQMNYVTTGLGSETLTVQSTVTYTDNTTTVVNGLTSFTTNTTSSSSLNNIITMIGAADGKLIKSIGFQAKSTISSSAGSLTVNVVGLNLP